jgi:uncharacterized protein (TIGR03435 family)
MNAKAKAMRKQYKSEGPGEDRLLLMIQSLFANRFSLRRHYETIVAPVYFLVGANRAGGTSTGLQVTPEGSCIRVENSTPPHPNACGSVGLGLNHLEAREISMVRLAEVLARVLDRQMIDRTGRPEKFNVSLRRAPDEHDVARASDDAILLLPDTPAVFTAVREQLGLKLEPGKAPVKLLSSITPRSPARTDPGLLRLSGCTSDDAAWPCG